MIMIRGIVHDPVFLAQPSAEADEGDIHIAEDLIDTLRANLHCCVGMAANMIGERKRIIAITKGPMVIAMMNPRIISRTGEYETEEGCLSLEGKKKTRRWKRIRVQWQDICMQEHIEILEGFQAQIVQHEIDHCNGILI